MATNTEPSCLAQIDTATLSAWRDGALAPGALSRIGAHIGDCAACQARLAQFDLTTQALLTQRELEPGDRILVGVRERATRLAQSPAWRRRLPGLETPAWLHGWRALRRRVAEGPAQQSDPHGGARMRLWGGAGAVASVAAVLLLFVYVFHALSLGAQTLGQGHATATPIETPMITPTSVPTITAPLVTQSPTIDAQSAWGTSAIVASLTTDVDSAHVFAAQSVTADGKDLLGYELTLNSDGSAATTTKAQAGILNIATRQFTPIGLADDPNFLGSCCTDDGRYLVATDNPTPQQTCGACNIHIWVYDRETHMLRLVTSGDQLHGEVDGILVSQGMVAVSILTTIAIAHLATGAVAPLAGTVANAEYRLLAFTWPYLVYSVGTASGTLAHARNLATGQDRVLTQLSGLVSGAGGLVGAAIVGDIMYFTLGNVQSNRPLPLYELDHLLTPNAQARVIAGIRTAGPILGANSRVVVFPEGVWDIAEQRFVNGPVANTGNGARIGRDNAIGLNGQYLSYTYPTTPIPSQLTPFTHERVVVYDTSQLPIH